MSLPNWRTSENIALFAFLSEYSILICLEITAGLVFKTVGVCDKVA